MGFLASDRPALVAFPGTVLPVLFLIGVLTVVRLLKIGVEDVAHLAARQRIRRRHMTLDPDGASYIPDLGALPDGGHPPGADALTFMGLAGERTQVLFTAATVVALVDSVLGGAGATIRAVALSLALPAAVALGVAVGIALVGVHLLGQRRGGSRTR